MDKVIKILAETFSMREEDIIDSLSMKECDSWSSLSHMEMIASLEDEFDIEFTADEIMGMISVEKIKEIVSKKIG